MSTKAIHYNRIIAAVQTQAKAVAVTGYACPKCAVIDRLGELSCCATNASWHKNCGRTGDSNFEHTWTEGFKACKNTERLSLTTVAPNHRHITVFQIQAKIMAATVFVCPQCAIDQSGKASCCAPTASWYQNCGRIGDSDFEHTWKEGLQACKDDERLFSESKHVLINQTPTSQQIHAVQNQSDHSSVSSAHVALAANCRSYNQISYTIVCTSVLMASFHIHLFCSFNGYT